MPMSRMVTSPAIGPANYKGDIYELRAHRGDQSPVGSAGLSVRLARGLGCLRRRLYRARYRLVVPPPGARPHQRPAPGMDLRAQSPAAVRLRPKWRWILGRLGQADSPDVA